MDKFAVLTIICEEHIDMTKLRSLKNRFFCFNGCIDRERFLYSVLAILLVSSITGVIITILGVIGGFFPASLGAAIRWGSDSSECATLITFSCLVIAGVLTVIVEPILIVSLISLVVRRLHDMKFSGYLGLVFLIPAVQFLFLLFLAIFPSRHEGNNYLLDGLNGEIYEHDKLY